MSIDTTKNFIEKSGCGKAFGVVIALVMIVSVFQSCGVGQNAQSEQAATPANEPSVVTVGKVGAPVSAFESLYERAIQIRETQVRAQAGDNFEGLSQSDRAIVYSEVAGQVVTNLINMHYAQEAGISISKDMALAESNKQFEDQVNTARQQLIQQGKLTATSTQEDLDKAIKELAGKTLTELRAENTATASDLYDSPGGKLILEGGAAVTAYKAQMESKTVVSEDELKKSFQSARLKSIVFKQNPTGPDRTAEAQKVLDEIKAGTITFEAAMDKYSQSPFAPKDKKPSQHEDILAMQFLLVDKDYAPIMDLKPGQMSAVIKGADGPVIYRLIKFEGSVPPDFEATKAEKMKNHKMFVANVAYFKRLEADMMTLPKFVDGGYEILYKTSMLMREAKYANLEEGLRNQARALTTGSPRPRDVGRFFLERRYYNKLKPEEKKTKFEPYLEAMRGFVSAFDGPTVRLDMVDLLIEMKSPAAGAELIPASLTNSTFGQMGQAFNTRINTALDKAKAAKLITPEEIKQVEENQKRWIEGKREYEKQIAAQAAQRKEAEAALAKEKADAEAAEKAKGKEPAKPGTSSSDLMAPPAPEKEVIFDYANESARPIQWTGFFRSIMPKLTLVPTPIGNLRDISPRCEDAMRTAHIWFVEDSRVSGKLQSHLGIKCPMRIVNEHTSEGAIEKYLSGLEPDADVILLTDAGTPGISDPGAIFVDMAYAKGFEIDALPGPSAVMNALMLSGFFAQRFAFLGYLGRKPGAIKSEFLPFVDSSLTIVVFESPFRVDATLALAHEVLGPRRFAITRELTKMHQQVVRGILPNLPTEKEMLRKGEFTLVLEGHRKRREL